MRPNSVPFAGLEEKLQWLSDEGYYDPAVLARYERRSCWPSSPTRINTVFASGLPRRVKFYTSYALRTFDGKRHRAFRRPRLHGGAIRPVVMNPGATAGR